MIIDAKELYEKIDEFMDQEVTIQGWIRNHRKQKEFGFIDFSDGTCFSHIQVVYDDKLDDFKYNEEVLSIENGYYHYELVCRTSDENKKKNVTKENATGCEIGVFDADKNILYYYWQSI